MDDVCRFCRAEHFAHKRLVCGAQLDQAKAEAAPLRAALRRYGGHGMDCNWTRGKKECACGFRAALSSDAGKGWLSPEQVREWWAMLDEIDRYPSPKPPGWTHKFNRFMERNRAALAAPKGVE